MHYRIYFKDEIISPTTLKTAIKEVVVGDMESLADGTFTIKTIKDLPSGATYYVEPIRKDQK